MSGIYLLTHSFPRPSPVPATHLAVLRAAVENDRYNGHEPRQWRLLENCLYNAHMHIRCKCEEWMDNSTPPVIALRQV